MISVELWRARIGLFNCSSQSCSLSPRCSGCSNFVSHKQTQSSSESSAVGVFLTLLLVVVTVHLLLSAGDVERNPGPITREYTKPVLKDLQYISYTSEDGTNVHFRLMDQIKPRVARLAIALGFPQHIRANLKTELDPVYYLLDEWLRGGNQEHDSRPLTWGTLITALGEAGLLEEVSILEQHFLVTPVAVSQASTAAVRNVTVHTQHSVSDSSGTPDMIHHPAGGYTIQHGPVEVFVKPDVPESLLSLMRSYADMLLVLRTTELPVDKFRRLKIFLSDFCDEKSIRHCSTVFDVIDLLKEHLKIYMFNIDTLNASYDYFCSSDVTGSLQQYRQQLDDFLSNTSVKEFKGTLKTKIDDSSKVETVTIILNENRIENTLEALRKLIYHFFGIHYKVLIHCGTEEGCVRITWIVPMSLVPTLREKADQLSPQYLASKGVLELVIGLRIAPNEEAIRSDHTTATAVVSMVRDPVDTASDHHYSMRAGIEEQQQNVMMIATIQKRHEDELAAVRKDISAYEERCDKLEKEKIDIEMNLEKVQRDMEILQQKFVTREQQLERNLDMAKRSAQAVISDLENKPQTQEKTHEQKQLVTEKEADSEQNLGIKLQSTPGSTVGNTKLQMVIDELEEVANDWKQLGNHLLSPHCMKEIVLYVQVGENPIKCLGLVIINWKELYPDGTWSDIITALVKMEKNELSNILQEKHLGPYPIPSSSLNVHKGMDLASHSFASNYEQSKKAQSQSQSTRSVPAVHSSSAQRSGHSVEISGSRDYYDIVMIGCHGRGKSTVGNKLLQACNYPSTTEQIIYSTQFIEGLGELDTCGTVPCFLTCDNVDTSLRYARLLPVTSRCQLVANENTKIRVLDTPPLSFWSKDGCTMLESDISLIHLIIRELLDPNNKLSVKRLLYFLPFRGVLEKVDGDLCDQLKAMHHCFGSTVFNNMVTIATNYFKYKDFDFTKEDIAQTQTVLLAAIRRATDEKLSKCPPVVYIGPDETCEEILHKIQTACVLHQDTSYSPPSIKTICCRCASQIHFSMGVPVGVLSGDVFENYDVTKCHPCFVPKYTNIKKIAGGIGHIATLGSTIGFAKALNKETWPGFTNSDEICPVCKCPPGSPGCCPVKQTVVVKGQTVTVDHRTNY